MSAVDTLTAAEVPFSSTVGKSVMFTAPGGAMVAQIAIMVPNPAHDYREVAEAVAARIVAAWNCYDPRSFPGAADGRPMPPMGDDLMIAGLSGEDARFVAIQLAHNGLALVPAAPVSAGDLDALVAELIEDATLVQNTLGKRAAAAITALRTQQAGQAQGGSALPLIADYLRAPHMDAKREIDDRARAWIDVHQDPWVAALSARAERAEGELAALRASACKGEVKALVWRMDPDRDDDYPRWLAETGLGKTYYVFKAWWGAQEKWGFVGLDGYHHSEAEAKAAAQADYEFRIRAALVSTPTEGNGEVAR